MTYAYSVDKSARDHLFPNLRNIASQPFMGLTAFVGEEPHLIIGREGEETYIIEDQFGQVKKIDFTFPWEEPRVESNKLVAASRTEESPFKTAGLLYYDFESGEWAVRVGATNMRYPLEERIAALEEQGWSKFALDSSGLDLGGGGSPSQDDHPGGGHGEPTIEVRAACPHCHSDQHLELMSSDHKNHPHSDEKMYACHNCGKWALEHELEVSDHDKDHQDENPEDVTYEHHEDDAKHHQQPEEEKEVHDDKHHFDADEDEKSFFNKKKKHSAVSEPFSFQGRPVVRVNGTRIGEAIKPEEQSDEEMLHHVQNLDQPHHQEQEFVRNRYKDLGLGNKPYSYDNPFINRGGAFDKEALGPFSLPKTTPSYPEEFPGGTYILVAKWLQPQHTIMFGDASGKGVDRRFKGIITMLGGPGSHAVVVAQGNDMPCIVVDGADIDKIQPGDRVVIDGTTGVVHVNGGNPNFVAGDPNAIQGHTELYRFAYANGHGHVEEMQPGAMVGDKGGHQGMMGSLMENGHAVLNANEDYTQLTHNVALGYFCDDGTIIQDVNEIPDEEEFLRWAHAQEAQLGLPQGKVEKLDISVYAPTGPASGGQQTTPAPLANELGFDPTGGPHQGIDEVMAKTAATFEMPYPGGQGVHNGTSAAFNAAGLHAVVTAPGLPQPITLPFSAANMFIMIKMFQAQGLLAPGTPIQVESDNPELAQQIIQQQSGVAAKVSYDEAVQDANEPEVGGEKLKGAITCPHCDSHTVEVLSKDEDKGTAEFLCLSCNNTFKDKYRKHAAAKHPKGTRVEMTHPSKKGIKGSITDEVGQDENFGDSLYDLMLDNGDELKKVPEIHFKKIKSASVVVIAALHDEVAEYAAMIAQATDQSADEIAADLADKGMIHSDDEWDEVCDIVNHLHSKNPHALANGNGDMSRWEDEGGAIYSSTRIADMPPTPAQPIPNSGQAGDQPTPPCPHCGSPTVGTPNYYWCPSCGWTSQSTSTPGGAPNIPGAPMNTPNLPAQTYHSNVKEAYEGQAEEKYFEYLDQLSVSGVTNMFGAAPYLEHTFGLSSQEAKQILVQWMHTFEQRHPHEGSVKSAALSVGEWYTMYSPDYKVPDVIQVVDVNDFGITANIEGDDKGLFPINLPHTEIEKAGYKFEPYNSPSQVKTAKIARRQFSSEEQNELVNENLEGRARNFHKLNLEGTHYTTEIEASIDPLKEEFYLW